jgi:putative MATE family efflux protein
LLLAWPVLAQQFLVLSVGLSDQFLAGHFQPVPKQEQAQAIGHRFVALGLLGQPGGGVTQALAAELPWELGRRIDARQVAYQAALTTALYLASFLSSCAVFVSTGGTALVSRFIGAGDRRGAVRATEQAFLLAVALGGLATPLILGGLDTMLHLLQLHDDTAAFAAAFLWPILGLLTFQMVELTGVACLAGAGDTVTGMGVLGGVAVINLPLAWCFFHGLGPIPRLGFVGIAWGTALSNTLGCLAVLTVLARGRAGLRIDFRRLRPDLPLVRRLLRIGVPAGLDNLSTVVCQLWFLSIVNRLGDVASSAHGIAIRWEGLGYLSGMAFGTAAMTLVGQNLGGGRPDRASRSGWVAFGLGCSVMSVMGAVFYLLAPQMFAVFCPHPEQRPVVEAGVPVLRLVAFAMPALACTIIFTAALRGAGDVRVPVLFTWFGFLVVRIPLAYFLSQEWVSLGPLGRWPGAGLGLFGAWLAMFADILVRGGFFLARFAGGRWQTVRV